MDLYCINKDQTKNPGFHHEVHTKTHAEKLGIRNRLFLGMYSNEIDAVQAGKRYFADADGCVICCPRAHKG